MRRKNIFLVAVLALLAFVSTANVGSAKGGFGDFPVGTKLENFTLPDLSSAEQSLDKLKGENGAFSFEFQRSVWSSKPTTKESTRSLMN